MRFWISYSTCYILSAKCARAFGSDTNEQESFVLSKLLCVSNLAALKWEESGIEECTAVGNGEDETQKVLLGHIRQHQATAAGKLEPKKLVEVLQIVKNYNPEYSKVEECIHVFCDVCSKYNFADVCKSVFDVANGGYCQYLHQSTYRIMDAAMSDVDMHPNVVRAIEESIFDYLEILTSVCNLSWGSKSESFDGKDIQNTNPGLLISICIGPSESMQNIMSRLAPNFLFVPQNTLVYLPVYKMTTNIGDHYLPVSVPCDFLAGLKKYMTAIMRKITPMPEDYLKGKSVHLTNKIETSGSVYPSQLVLAVNYGNIGDELISFTKNVDLYAKWWKVVYDSVAVTYFQSIDNDFSITKYDRSWAPSFTNLIEEHFAGKVVLGVLKSGNDIYDDILIQDNGDCNRALSPMFAETAGTEKNNRISQTKMVMSNGLALNELERSIISESKTGLPDTKSVRAFLAGELYKRKVASLLRDRKTSYIKDEVADILNDMTDEIAEILGLAIEVTDDNRIQNNKLVL